MSEPPQGSLEVDWDQAGRWAGRLASPGPTASRADLARLVGELHDAATRAHGLALRSSRLADLLPDDVPPTPVLVVDRAGWARAAAQSFGSLAGGRGEGRVAAVRAVPATAQAAGMLGLLASRVLGQFDPFAADGRLLLVAPNVLRVERDLSADPADFRLWVCVHEQTHALQFAAAPWLAAHLRDEVGSLVTELSQGSAGQEILAAVQRGLRSLRQGGDDEWGVLEAVLDDAQRDRVERLTAVMSLLEGHADVTMDAVGTRSIPSARRLRARFDARRRTATGIDRLLRRLLGMDAKLEQYRRGAAFVRGARRAGGRRALDPVWSGPEALPTPVELTDPAAWVRRVHG
ncbi:hypothetical protein GXB85_13165 [Cellulomonas sp. APG4]|uniref:zinc-dependent metalloprotease n=1 Tax=Cellulomonas sp. APG4 TaxID=1538656 RepID=UPI00137A77E1|nr:zinc-dependent metalloprotease [Cellulomonas sp. APG4]NCT91895.1 hypothetical protein [Cellulomonas sp. APG4]